MRIAGAQIDGCRSLPDRGYSFIDPSSGRAHDLVVVVGPPASGKTTFLETLIAAKEQIAPYGASHRPDAFLRRNAVRAKVTLRWELSEREVARTQLSSPLDTETIFGAGPPEPGTIELALRGILGSYSREPTVGKFEYFHAKRSLPLSPRSSPGIASSTTYDRFLRLTADSGKYGQLPQFLAERSNGPRLEEMRAAIAKVCSSKSFSGAHFFEGALVPHFYDRRREWTAVWNDLTASEQQAILFAATFVWAGINDSVVFIDSPEADVGERHVVDFVRGIAALGHHNQIICATGSRALAEAVHPSALVTLE